MREYVGAETLANLGDTFREVGEQADAVPAQAALISKHDGAYPGYLEKVQPTRLLAIARGWSKDAAAQMPLLTAAYEHTADPLVKSHAAELMCRAMVETQDLDEANVWALRALGPLGAGDTSFDAVPGEEQAAISVRLEELKASLAPYLELPLRPGSDGPSPDGTRG